LVQWKQNYQTGFQAAKKTLRTIFYIPRHKSCRVFYHTQNSSFPHKNVHYFHHYLPSFISQGVNLLPSISLSSFPIAYHHSTSFYKKHLRYAIFYIYSCLPSNLKGEINYKRFLCKTKKMLKDASEHLKVPVISLITRNYISFCMCKLKIWYWYQSRCNDLAYVFVMSKLNTE
jgi:hypothetical protein